MPHDIKDMSFKLVVSGGSSTTYFFLVRQILGGIDLLLITKLRSTFISIYEGIFLPFYLPFMFLDQYLITELRRRIFKMLVAISWFGELALVFLFNTKLWRLLANACFNIGVSCAE